MTIGEENVREMVTFANEANIEDALTEGGLNMMMENSTMSLHQMKERLLGTVSRYGINLLVTAVPHNHILSISNLFHHNTFIILDYMKFFCL